ncbi:MAG: ABC transporter ATP-binding protein [Anaerolineae bacterium]|nr:ABC transporter ATP-binding protein [Anaerolineae bacterium]
MTAAIQIESLRFAYPALAPGEDTPWVLEGLNLTVEPGEWVTVMGASDVGKTTLCLLLAGLAPHLTGGQMEGRIVVAGRDTHDHPPPELADLVGLVLQEVEAQLFNPTVEAEVAWGLENLGLPVAEVRARVDEMLDFFQIDRYRHRRPAELSGGEKKRLALASVLAMHPRVLILDEPMGGLDPAGRRDLLAALSDLQRRAEPVTIVMTESDPEAAAAFASRLLVLAGGRFVLEGAPGEMFARPEQLAALGVASPQLARLAAALNRRLGMGFEFSTVAQAREALAERLGWGRP